MGKLSTHNSNDKPATGLLKKIQEDKNKLIDTGKHKKEKKLPDITDHDQPFILPKGWSWTRLNSITELITKGSSPKWQNVSYTNDTSDILFITSENVGNYKLILNKTKFVEKKFNNIEPRSILKKNDFLMNIVGGSIEGPQSMILINLQTLIKPFVLLD